MAAFSCGKNKDSSSEPDGDTQQDELTETPLKVAVVGSTSSKLEPALAEFDTARKDITLNITHYENEDTHYSEAFNQLSREMLSGESPDVIIAPCEGTVNLQKSGYLADLTPYINSSDTLNITGINVINKFAASDIYGRFNGAPMTYVGYPSADNNGAYVNIPHLWAIPEYSVNKDAAWRLLENYFRQSEQKKMSIEYVSGVPVTESGLQALAYDTPSVIGMSVRGNLAQWLGGEESMQISDEAVEKLLDYSRNVKIDLNYGDELDSMISNEWAEVMRGNISSDECVQNLNNKVGLYLSERS